MLEARLLTKNEVIGIVKTALEVAVVDENSSSETISEWDSLGHLSILTALDGATNGAVSDLTDLAKAYSVKAILALLDSKSLLSK